MPTPVRLSLILALLTLTRGLAHADDKPDPREKLETIIPEAIRLLEAKEYVKSLKLVAAPAEIERFTRDTTLEDFAAEFGMRQAGQLLKALRSIRGASPALNSDGTEATFKLPEAVGSKEEMVWLKVEKYWFLKN